MGSVWDNMMRQKTMRQVKSSEGLRQALHDALTNYLKSTSEGELVLF